MAKFSLVRCQYMKSKYKAQLYFYTTDSNIYKVYRLHKVVVTMVGFSAHTDLVNQNF